MIGRPIRPQDIEPFYALTQEFEAGSGAKFRVDKKALAKLIETANQSFHKEVTTPDHEQYLFVLEKNKQLIGTFGVVSHRDAVMVSYQLDETKQLLRLSKALSGLSYFSSLFVTKAFRGQGGGKCLRNIVLGFIEEHPERFTKKLVAEYRGVYNQHHQNAFLKFALQSNTEIDDYYQYLDLLQQGQESILTDQLRPTIQIQDMPSEFKSLINTMHPESQPNTTIFQTTYFPSGHIAYSSGAPIYFYKP